MRKSLWNSIYVVFAIVLLAIVHSPAERIDGNFRNPIESTNSN